MSINKWTARFRSGETEDAYQVYSRRTSMKTSVTVLYVGCFVYLLYSFLDIVALERASQFALWTRVVLVFIALILLQLVKQVRFQKHLRLGAAVVMVICSVSICMMIWVESDISPPYYIGIIQVVIFFTTMVHLSFIAAVISFFVVGISFHLAVSGFPYSDELFTGYFFILNVFCTLCVVCWLLETSRRAEYIEYRRRRTLNFEVRSLYKDARISLERKNAFLNIMTHIFKTPLHQIIGYSEIIKKAPFGPLGHPEYENYNLHIESSARAALHQVARIGLFSRVDSGMVRAKRIPVSFQELQEELSEYVDNEEFLHVESASISSRRKLFIDPKLTVRAIVEILENASFFRLKGSQIDICWKEIDGKCILEVSNSTSDIDDQVFSGLSAKWYSTEDYLSVGERPGIGLGLAHRLLALTGCGLEFLIEDKTVTGRISIPFVESMDVQDLKPEGTLQEQRTEPGHGDVLNRVTRAS